MKKTIHQKVQALLQSSADKRLVPQEQLLLDGHLAECVECRSYARGLDELQDGLRRVMRQQWQAAYTPAPLQTIKERSRRAALQNRISSAIGRLAVLPVVAIVFMMTMRMATPQTLAVGLTSAGTPGAAFHTPTPTSHLTATRLVTQEFVVQDCEHVTYAVQPGDSLDGIAARYDVSRQVIMGYNGLANDNLAAGMQLVIPLCGALPAGTTTTPTVTITSLPQPSDLNPPPNG